VKPYWKGEAMTTTVQAVYTEGVLRPVQPLALAEGETVEVTISQAAVSMSEEEIIRRIQACKTYREWLEVTKLLPPDDGDYDIVKALDENRRWSGERTECDCTAMICLKCLACSEHCACGNDRQLANGAEEMSEDAAAGVLARTTSPRSTS
jgi:predicted DNA-binding antitoxin AbrB/MazE fold protein